MKGVRHGQALGTARRQAPPRPLCAAFAGEASTPSQGDDKSEGDGGSIGGVLDPLTPGAGDDDPLETVPEETNPEQVNPEQDESGSATNTDTGQATDAITDLSMS